MEEATRALFEMGQEMANEQGLILVDTKYEFGTHKGDLYLMDEIHTPDSSRYYYSKGYEEKQASGAPQEQLSKEFVREWLMEHDFQGKDGQQMPEMPGEFVTAVSERYIQLYELITGKEFIRGTTDNVQDRIRTNVERYLASC
jgi:phosphoribosylaminoimidazole-succinocarboxamide synthase